MIKNIQFITGLHGDEHSPILALASIGIDQIVANPKAVSKNTRFIKRDMNASFGTKGSSYEEKEARKLLRRLDKNYLVVDLHTTQTTNTPFVIIVDKKMLPFARKLGVKRVVCMDYNIKKGHSLIDYRNGVSVETGNHNSKTAFRITTEIVTNLRKNKNHPVDIYEVYGKIEKPGKYVNFELYGKQFYPVFAGKNAYGIIGLKARKV